MTTATLTPPAPALASPDAAERPLMAQTPAHSIVNHDLLGLMPTGAQRVVEVGCMHGALAQAYRRINPAVHYTGIDIDPDYAQVAATHCQRSLAVDIERLPAPEFDTLFPSDCWVFGDCLEHLRNPWGLLRRIRDRIDASGRMVVCLPNAQHWSVQMRLASGRFHYEDSGLLDRTHLRWFTRLTMVEMFQEAGWRVEQGLSRSLPQQAPEALMAALRQVAMIGGADPVQATADANAFQYLFRLVPA